MHVLTKPLTLNLGKSLVPFFQIRTLTFVAMLVCSACGGDEVTGPEELELGELCGQDTPVRILTLDPAKKPLSADSAPGRFVVGELVEDRYLFTLTFEDSQSEIWSVGRCGEQPALLASNIDRWGMDRIVRYEQLPGVPFVCRGATNDVVALDPRGVQASNAVFEVAACVALPTSHGLLTILGDGETGQLVLQPWPADVFVGTAEQIVLLEDVKARPLPGGRPYDVFAATDEEVLAINTNDELVSVALDDLAPTVLAEGVGGFHRGASGRWVVWQGVQVTNDDPDSAEGPIFALDRDSGISTQVEDAALADTTTGTTVIEPLGLLYFDHGMTQHYVKLPSLESFLISEQLKAVAVIDDTRALLFFPFTVIDVVTGELTALFGDRHDTNSWDDDGLVILREGEGGELLGISYSGEQHVLAKHATRAWQRASDGRIFTLPNMNSAGVGTMIAVDPNTLEESQVDSHVHHSSISLYEEDGKDLVVSYTIVDPDPARHGIWLARPAH